MDEADWLAARFEEQRGRLRAVAATRQLASRTRRRVQGAVPSREVDLARQRQVVDAFLAALPTGATMRGAQAVGSYALTFSGGVRFVQPALVNGAVGLAIGPPGRLIGALGFTFADGTITVIDMISDAERLRHVDLAALGD